MLVRSEAHRIAGARARQLSPCRQASSIMSTTDASRRGRDLSAEFVDGAKRLIDQLAGATTGRAGVGAKRCKAIRRLTMLVRAVVVARAVGPGPLRDEVIAACSGDSK